MRRDATAEVGFNHSMRRHATAERLADGAAYDAADGAADLAADGAAYAAASAASDAASNAAAEVRRRIVQTQLHICLKPAIRCVAHNPDWSVLDQSGTLLIGSHPIRLP
jgi:hypothetical protein